MNAVPSRRFAADLARTSAWLPTASPSHACQAAAPSNICCLDTAPRFSCNFRIFCLGRANLRPGFCRRHTAVNRTRYQGGVSLVDSKLGRAHSAAFRFLPFAHRMMAEGSLQNRHSAWDGDGLRLRPRSARRS